MKIRISELKRKASERPDGYVDKVLAAGRIQGDALIITPEVYANLLKEFNPSAVANRPRASCCGSHPTNPQPLAIQNQKKEMPPLPTQAKNAVAAAGRVISSVVKGVPVKAPDEVVKMREDICQGCEFLDKVRNRCSKCGCWYKTKISLASERCPIGKWEEMTL